MILLFSQKMSFQPYPSLHFDDNCVHQVQLQKPLGLALDPKLRFYEYIQYILNKTCKIVGLIDYNQSYQGQPCYQFISPSLDLTLIMEMSFMI